MATEQVNVSELVRKGEECRLKNQFDEANGFFDKALAVDLNNITALLSKAHTLYQQKQYAAAIEMYNKVISANKNTLYAWLWKGMAFYYSAQCAQAIECLDEALKLKNDDGFIWACKAMMLRAAGQEAQSQLCRDKALVLLGITQEIQKSVVGESCAQFQARLAPFLQKLPVEERVIQEQVLNEIIKKRKEMPLAKRFEDAVNNGHLSVVKECVEEGADIEASIEYLDKKNPLPIKDTAVPPLICATARGHFDVVMYLVGKLKEYYAPQNQAFYSGALNYLRGRNEENNYQVFRGYYNGFYGYCAEAKAKATYVCSPDLTKRTELLEQLPKQFTFLHAAVISGNLALVKFALEDDEMRSKRQYSVNQYYLRLKFDESNTNPYLRTDQEKRPSREDMLCVWFNALTPIGLAAIHRRHEVAEYLLQRGAKRSVMDEYQHLFTGPWFTVNCVDPMGEAAGNDDIPMMELLQKYNFPIDGYGSSGFTPLMAAAASGATRAVNYLLQRRASINLGTLTQFEYRAMVEVFYNYTALHLAAGDKRYELVKTLLAAGANPLEGCCHYYPALSYHHYSSTMDLKQYKVTEIKQNVVDLAILSKDERLLNILYSEVSDVSCSDLTYYSSNLSDEQLRFFNSFSGCRLFKCVRTGNARVIEFLFADENTSKYINSNTVNTFVDSEGNTALHIACKYGHKYVVEMLIRNGANVNKQNNKGETPLYYAMSTNANPLSVMEALCENYADINVPKINADVNESLIMLAVRLWHMAVNRTPLRDNICSTTEICQQIFDFLLRREPQLDHRDNNGRTVLLLAAHYGYEHAVGELLRRRNFIDIFACDYNNNNALTLAAMSKRALVVPLLIDAGFPIDHLNQENKIPWQYWPQQVQLFVAHVLFLIANNQLPMPTKDQLDLLFANYRQMTRVREKRTLLHVAYNADNDALIAYMMEFQIQDAGPTSGLLVAEDNDGTVPNDISPEDYVSCDYKLAVVRAVVEHWDENFGNYVERIRVVIIELFQRLDNPVLPQVNDADAPHQADDDQDNDDGETSSAVTHFFQQTEDGRQEVRSKRLERWSTSTSKRQRSGSPGQSADVSNPLIPTNSNSSAMPAVELAPPRI